MNVPPLVRIGPVPMPHGFGEGTSYVVLTRGGWSVAYYRWSNGRSFLYHEDTREIIQPNDVLCWLPQDGS